MLSIIIPSYKEPLLQKTINSVIVNAEGDIEIIAVLDGYWPNPQLEDHPKLKVLHLGNNRGMREAVNAGVAVSRGDYIMKSDAHCMFGKGFDKILLERIRDNWIVVPRQYQLDAEKWEVMKGRGNDYNKLIFLESRNKFTGLDWISRTKQRRNKMIDDTMTFQGSCWLMSRKWWDKAIKKLDSESYGSCDQEATELAMKTFVAGGRNMVNKNTWYAHKHRKFGRTHRITGIERKKASDHVIEIWKDDYERYKQHFRI